MSFLRALFACSFDGLWRLPVLAALIGGGVIGFALVLQYGFGLHPCALCLYQRWPWGIVILLGVVAVAGRRVPLFGGLVCTATALALMAGTGIALYHHGIEQHWWQNVIECSTGLPDARDFAAFKAALLAKPPVACDQIPWSFLGLSMAAWNFILSLLLWALVVGNLVQAGIRHFWGDEYKFHK